jgi:hypothetical protein
MAATAPLYARPESSEDSNAPRRGLAGGATEQLPCKAAGSLAPADGPTAEPSWSPSTAGAVHRNTVGWPSARPLGVVAQEGRTPAVPPSACPHPRPAAVVQCPVRTSSLHACLPTTGVQSPVSERPGCPVSAVGVRCPSVPASAVSDQDEVVEGGGGAGSRVAGMAGSACSPTVSTTGSSEPGGSRLRRPRWARGGVGLDSAIVVGGGGAVARSIVWATRIARMRARIAPLVGEPGAPRGGDYAPWSSCAAKAESPGRCELPGLDCDLSLRPCCGRNMQ